MSCTKELISTIEGHGAALRVHRGKLSVQHADQLPAYLREALREDREAVTAYVAERQRRQEAQQTIPASPTERLPFYRANYSGDWWNGPLES